LPAGKGSIAKRPGQRTRRKLYERMYGDEARHIREHKGGAVATSAGAPAQVAGKKRKQEQQPQAQQAQEAEQPVHPSWSAKQKEKHLLLAAPAGTKTTFDDFGGSQVRVVVPAAKAASLVAGSIGAAMQCGSKGHAARRTAATRSKAAGHPSWEAAKLRRRQQAQMLASAAAPQSQKIIFD
jgi:BUD22